MTKEIDYQALSSELDSLLSRLQSEELAINEAIKLYEHGLDITKQLETYLKEAENKVTKIRADLES